LLVAQREPLAMDPVAADLHVVGTLAEVGPVTRLPDGKLRVTVDARARAAVHEVGVPAASQGLVAHGTVLEDVPPVEPDVAERARELVARFEDLVRAARTVSPEILDVVRATQEPGALADAVARHAGLRPEAVQEVLATADVAARVERVRGMVARELEVFAAERRGRARGRRAEDAPDHGMGLPRERDEREEVRAELAELEARVLERPLPPDARERVHRELRKLRTMNPLGAEAGVSRGWLEWVAALPWSHTVPVDLDLDVAARVLREDHHGLRAVKTRVLEYLSVLRLRGGTQGSVLCLVGPPGVGKTSLARSIARATGRPFVRVALGGVRDEAEIRGHRRTYVGAMPGRILSGLKRAGASNPLFLLDEIDKLASDVRGDPASALLEVLDPEQNAAFADHYLDLDTDLSRVLFVCTANSTAGIPPALLDRLEIVRIGGYTAGEKRAIAARHLLPRQRDAAGLREDQLVLRPSALTRLVREYTREAGVRGLEREIGAVCRKVARRVVARGPDTRVTVDGARLERLLGPPRHRGARLGAEDAVGFVNGLAWTSSGGVMVPIEAAVVPGGGKTTMTGQLGSVFRESCEAALTYLRSRATQLGLERDAWQGVDVHVHVPELWGVDGPSAGITLTTALVSAVCRIAVRRDVAMTGEVTLRGRVRPIGGLKEKLLAASQAGVKRVLVPSENARELREVPRAVRDSLDIRLVDHMDEVLALALAVDDPASLFQGRVTTSGAEPPLAS
ncbi:MAG: hypothetical protein RLZZ299_1588, partial [Pseudomonadota bacterium]